MLTISKSKEHFPEFRNQRIERIESVSFMTRSSREIVIRFKDNGEFKMVLCFGDNRVIVKKMPCPLGKISDNEPIRVKEFGLKLFREVCGFKKEESEIVNLAGTRIHLSEWKKTLLDFMNQVKRTNKNKK